jgi:signal transduction histidine kinase/PAS domain-containing protein/ActR/RegA family two-component response regulator
MKKPLATVTIALLLLAALGTAGRYNYLLFHSLAELFAIIIACGIFMVAWNARRYIENQFLLFVGIAYLFVGILDIAHTLTYRGMSVLAGYDANAPTQLWIAARYMESLTLLIAPLTFRRQIKTGLFVLGYSAVTLLLLLSILHWGVFPDCFLENAGGLTPFKKASEYIISAILLASGLLLLHYRSRFDGKVLLWVLLSILMKIFSELAFSTYADVYDNANLIGHYFKIVSFFLIYKAIVETGLAKPYDLLFRDLKRNRESYRALFANMINGLARHRVLYDRSGKPVDYEFLEVNEAFYRLTGLADVVGKKVTEVIPGIRNEPMDWIGTFGALAAEGRSLRFENYSESLRKWYSVIAYSPAKGEFATIFEDISDRKQSEKALRQSEARFKLLSDTAGRLLGTEDLQGVVDTLCRKVMEHLDCQAFFNFMVDPKADRLRLNAYAGIPAHDASRIEWLDYGVAVCGCVARDGQRIIAEDILNTPDLNTELVKSYGIQAYCCHPLIVQGQLIGTLSFGTKTRPRFTPDEIDLMQTVTHQVALAAQRLQAQAALRSANEELEKKIQQRTATLAQMVDTLEEEVDQRQRVENQLRLVNEQLSARAHQLRALTGELAIAEQRERTRLARILHDGLQQHLAAAKMQLACVAEQLTDPQERQGTEAVIAMMAQSIQMARSLSTDLSPPVLHERGFSAGLEWLARWMRDNHHFHVALSIEKIPKFPVEVKIILFECIRELLFNTVKHAKVCAATVHLRMVDGKTIAITVEDEGAGFDPSRLKQDGDGGFGLFSVRERIGLLGGLLLVESAPGKGSRFTMTLPYSKPPVPTPPVQPTAAPAETCAPDARPLDSRKPISVLVADDHALFRDGIVRLLDRNPDIAIVGQANNGREAISLARKLVPDVILMDISMPELNGIEATRVIHRELPAIRIIGLSMHDEEDGYQKLREAGAVGFQSKSSTATELVSAIRTAVQVATA